MDKWTIGASHVAFRRGTKIEDTDMEPFQRHMVGERVQPESKAVGCHQILSLHGDVATNLHAAACRVGISRLNFVFICSAGC